MLHCTDRMPPRKVIDVENITQINQLEFKVKGDSALYSVTLGPHMPHCTCPDWQTYHLPCKHMLAVINLDGVGWSKIATEYREQPVFKLDDQCLAGQHEKQPEQQTNKNLPKKENQIINESQTINHIHVMNGNQPITCEVDIGLSDDGQETHTHSVDEENEVDLNVLKRSCRNTLREIEGLIFNANRSTLKRTSDNLNEMKDTLKREAPKIGDLRTWRQGRGKKRRNRRSKTGLSNIMPSTLS